MYLLESPHRGDSKKYTKRVFLQNSNEKLHDPLIFLADQIDAIKNFAVITNVVTKRVHCSFIRSGSNERERERGLTKYITVRKS